jgi:hypothetical protein
MNHRTVFFFIGDAVAQLKLAGFRFCDGAGTYFCSLDTSLRHLIEMSRC